MTTFPKSNSTLSSPWAAVTCAHSFRQSNTSTGKPPTHATTASRDLATGDDAKRRKSLHTRTKRARPAGGGQRALVESRRVVQPDLVEAATRTRNGYHSNWTIRTG